jgi:predicted flap endonuclease-1-like 5' DNA nuclease
MLKLRYLLLGLLLGMLLAWYWNAEHTTSEAQPVNVPPRPEKKQSKDLLTEIDGIGPAYERALNALGIFTFAQLAQQKADVLAAGLPARVTAERIQREKWIEQARKRSQ